MNLNLNLISPRNESPFSIQQQLKENYYNIHSARDSTQRIVQFEKIINNYSFALNDVIGKGQFSKVYVGKNKETRKPVAIKVAFLFKYLTKVIDLKSINNAICMTLLENEIAILKMIDNKNLLKVIEIQSTVNNMYIITEYCNQGDLNHFIKKLKTIDEKQALNIFRHLITGLNELQKNLIIHRDIKPANILISNGIPKIADFGFAIQKYFSEKSFDELSKFNVGTPLYMSPETLLSNVYSFKSDIWALGIVLYEMLFGEVPFFFPNEKDLKQNFQSYQQNNFLQFPKAPQLCDSTYSMIKGMLYYDPVKRWSMEQIIKHLEKNRKALSIQTVETIPDDESKEQQRPYVKQTVMQKKMEKDITANTQRRISNFCARQQSMQLLPKSPKPNVNKNLVQILSFLTKLKKIIQLESSLESFKLVYYIQKLCIFETENVSVQLHIKFMKEEKEITESRRFAFFKDLIITNEHKEDYFRNFKQCIDKFIFSLKQSVKNNINQQQKLIDGIQTLRQIVCLLTGNADSDKNKTYDLISKFLNSEKSAR